MARGLREKLLAMVLPCLDMHRGIAPPLPVHPRARVGITRQAAAQVINSEIDGLGQARQGCGAKVLGIDPALLHIIPKHVERQFHDRRHLQERGDSPPMQRRHQRVADQLVIIAKHGGQLIAAPVKADAQKTDIGHSAHKCRQGAVAALLDQGDGFGRAG